jgi:uncharacterized protein (TIGR02145 family)
MQQMTSDFCTQMSAYPSSTSDRPNTIELVDTRNGQGYRIRKLLDNNCWMIDNIRIDDIQLIPDDSNVPDDSFTLPPAGISGASNQTQPQVWNPGGSGNGVPGSSTNYGYLYNYWAATAGTGATLDAGEAPGSVCPASWRLPTGGPGGEFDTLNTLMGDSQSAWVLGGPFQGVLGGYYSSGLNDQTVDAYYYSSTPQSSSRAWTLYFGGYLSPSDSGGKQHAFAVRCLIPGEATPVDNGPEVPATGTVISEVSGAEESGALMAIIVSTLLAVILFGIILRAPIGK